MEQTRIAALLEKYWQAETTVEEEKQLAEYFSQPTIPAEWEPLRHVFAYFVEEAKITTGADFESRLLERIRSIDASDAISFGSNEHSGAGPGLAHKPAPVRPLFPRAPWWAAAAVIILSLGLSRLIESPGTSSPGQGSLAQSGDGNPAKTNSATAYSDVNAMKDTYDDPQQALAAIRRALGTASAKMNHGKSITQKQMDRMSGGWQSVLTN